MWCATLCYPLTCAWTRFHPNWPLSSLQQQNVQQKQFKGEVCLHRRVKRSVHRVREGVGSGDTACYVWLEQEESFGYKRGSISKPPASSGQAKGSSYRYYSIPKQHCDLGTGAQAQETVGDISRANHSTVRLPCVSCHGGCLLRVVQLLSDLPQKYVFWTRTCGNILTTHTVYRILRCM